MLSLIDLWHSETISPCASSNSWPSQSKNSTQVLTPAGFLNCEVANCASRLRSPNQLRQENACQINPRWVERSALQACSTGRSGTIQRLSVNGGGWTHETRLVCLCISRDTAVLGMLGRPTKDN